MTLQRKTMVPSYLLNLNPTSYGVYKNIRNANFVVHLFHQGGGLAPLLEHDNVVVYPLSLEDDPDLISEKLVEIQNTSPVPGIIYVTSDAELAFLDSFRNLYKNDFFISLPPSHIISLVNNKYAFHADLDSRRIPTPRTFLVDLNNLNKCLSNNLPWPCLVKPIFSSEWKTARAAKYLGGKKAIVVADEECLRSVIRDLISISKTLLVQEIIDVSDEGSFSYCCYADDQGKVLWEFVTQKLLQHPERFGTAILCRTVDRPDVAELGRKTIENLGVSGVSETEIVIQRHTRQLFVIEINTRFWLQHRLSTHLGVNLCVLDYYFKSGNLSMVDKMISGSNKDKPGKALWVDDYGFMVHTLKNLIRGKKKYFQFFPGSQIEFSCLERRNILPYLRLVMRKILS